MADDISRDEFIRIFGMTPEDYQRRFPERVTSVAQPARPTQKQPQQVTPVTAVVGTQRRQPLTFGGEAVGTRVEEPAYKSDVRRQYEAAGKQMPPVMEALDVVGAPLEQGIKNINAGVLALPSSIAGFAGLIQHGLPALVKGAMSDDEQKGYIDSVADAFVNDMIDEEGEKRLVQLQETAREKFLKENPQATEDDADKFLDWYSGTQEFYDATMRELPAAFRMAQGGQDWANDMAGLGKRADQMSAGDDAMQILSSAFVGLPAGAVSKLTQPLVRAVGSRIANNLAVRVGARVAEAATPLTLPLTPTNVAINAGVGTAINEGIRAYQGRDTLIDYQNVYDPDKFPEPETLVAATGIAAGALFGLPGVAKAITAQTQNNVSKAIKSVGDGQIAGPTLADQSDQLTPKLSPITGLADQNAPVKKGAQLYKLDSDTETVPALDAAMSAASTVNRVEFENNALNYGILEGLNNNTVPFAEIKAIYDRLDAATQDTLDKYVYAVQRKQDATLYEKDLISQLRTAQADVMTARMTGNGNALRSATDKFTELQQKYTALQKDDVSSRSSMQGWTRADVDNFIRIGESNQAVKQLGDAMRKISHDLVDFRVANGRLSAAEGAEWKRSRDLYVKLTEREHPEASGLKRRALLFGDKLKNSFKEQGPDQQFFVNTAQRNVTDAGAAVNNPLRAIDALQISISEAVRDVAANNTRREVVDRLSALPKAYGELLRPFQFKIGQGRTTSSISQAQYAKLYPRGIPQESDYVKIFRNGNIEFWEFSDKSITKSLQFAPLASVPIMNATRKIWQTMTTGLAAPWFAAKTFLWDAPLAQTTKNAGRSLGLIDTLGRRLAQGTALERPVDEVLDRMFDPTVFVSSGIAIPYQLGMRAARAVGVKVATDLATNSGVFNAIYKSGPSGQKFVESVGTFMANAFDRSALGIMSRNMSTSLSHLNDVSKMAESYAAAALKHTGPVKVMFEGYKAMLESIHMATKTAFFMSNYGRLKQLHGANIPASEIKKLVQETRNLTGDMSRQSNSRFIQRLTSVIPYSNAMLQGTRHILSAAVPQWVARGVNTVGGNMLTDRNSRFWAQFTSGVLLPSLGATSVLSQWDGAEDYWYNRVPKWQQMTGIPIPNVETLEEFARTGKWPQFTPDRLNIVPLSPEFSIIMEPVKAGLRAMGLVGSAPTRIPQPMSAQIKDVMDQITSFSTPPALAGLFAANGSKLDLHKVLTGQGIGSPARPIPSGGANADMMTANSHIPQTVYDTVGALVGSAAQIVIQSWNVADISYRESEEAWKAAGDALGTMGFEVARRLPQIDVPGLFNARERLYQSTPEAEYVYRTEDELEPIIGSGRQVSVERDKSGRIASQEAMGLETAKKLKDQNLLSLSQLVYNNLALKGPYKQAKEAASEIRATLYALEASRYKVSEELYNTRRNDYIRLIQEHTRTQADLLQSLERQLQKQIGRRFAQQYGVPFSYKALSDLVRKDVAR